MDMETTKAILSRETFAHIITGRLIETAMDAKIAMETVQAIHQMLEE